MNQIDNNQISIEEKIIKEKLEDLKFRVAHLCEALPCMTQCSDLSSILQRIYELREGLKQLEWKRRYNSEPV